MVHHQIAFIRPIGQSDGVCAVGNRHPSAAPFAFRVHVPGSGRADHLQKAAVIKKTAGLGKVQRTAKPQMGVVFQRTAGHLYAAAVEERTGALQGKDSLPAYGDRSKVAAGFAEQVQVGFLPLGLQGQIAQVPQVGLEKLGLGDMEFPKVQQVARAVHVERPCDGAVIEHTADPAALPRRLEIRQDGAPVQDQGAVRIPGSGIGFIAFLGRHRNAFLDPDRDGVRNALRRKLQVARHLDGLGGGVLQGLLPLFQGGNRHSVGK